GITKSVCALLCVAAALTAPVARADIASPDVTCDTKGAACDNAAPNGVGVGVCSAGVPVTAFGRPSCGPAGDAGTGQTECLFCQAAQGGSGGAGGSGTAGTGNSAGATNTAGASAAGASAGGTSSTAGSASSAGTSSSDSGGCSVRQLGTERGIATFMLGLGLAALALGRRRR
ncbi:MAG TPA: hypothetical protein VNW92_23995, partial [Polyangiaceae bacterium]|nr:hypothetical protein [Polyangiaceae bacterium]